MAVAILASLCTAASFSQTSSSYDDVAQSSLPENVLCHVIARDGKSRTTQTYFRWMGVRLVSLILPRAASTRSTTTWIRTGILGKTEQRCVNNTPRPADKKGDDTGWGCYSQKWWNEGMRKFLEANESKDIQHRAWAQLMKPVIKDALAHKWQSGRQLAIALSIANSLGAAGFNRLATKEQWDAEKSLNAYAQTSDHTKRRRDALNQTFP